MSMVQFGLGDGTVFGLGDGTVLGIAGIPAEGVEVVGIDTSDHYFEDVAFFMPQFDVGRMLMPPAEGE